MNNIIPFKLKQKNMTLSEHEISALIMGLIKIVKKDSSCAKEKEYLNIISEQNLQILKLKSKIKLNYIKEKNNLNYAKFVKNSGKLLSKIKQN